MRTASFLIIALVALGLTVNSHGDDSAYLKQIKPVLKARCYACHGALKQESGLRLDTAAEMIDAGILANGELVQRIRSVDHEERMPPEGEALQSHQIQTIIKWIDSGAPVPENEQPDSNPASHWAFQPFKKNDLPESNSSNPIDALLEISRREHAASRKNAHKLVPNPSAPPIVLIRRLYLDLTGLPPTEKQIDSFLENPSTANYQQTVAELLNSPQHGERWARHWMDIWRYSDWWGLGQQHRNSQKHIWHWRDWIIESLNKDVAYDEMIRQMLAADELYPKDQSKLRATGYLGRNWFLFNRHQWLDETVEHVGKGLLGLTMNCAKCHDHKYDPISHEDYYSMRAFFEPYQLRLDMIEGEVDFEKDGIPRVFDAYPETPTYLFVRGDENNPDKSVSLKPKVPEIFDFRPNPITPIELPQQAWQPGHKLIVAENHIAVVEKQIGSARKALSAAQSELVSAKQKETQYTKTVSQKPNQLPGQSDVLSKVLVADSFQSIDTKRWKKIDGKWTFDKGKLRQTKDGATNSMLQLLDDVPRDFDASFKFTILGGSQWRSVGISFDSSQQDFSQTPKASDKRNQVYISAFSGGPKIQGAFQIGNVWQYPAHARTPQKIVLNQSYLLRLQVRDRLVNASINGVHALSWILPHQRQKGAMLLTTFDAIVDFEKFTLKKLDQNAVLKKAANSPSGEPQNLAEAKKLVVAKKQKLQIAESNIDLLQTKLDWTIQRANAIRANLSGTNSQKKKALAIKSGRKHKLLLAQHNLLKATFEFENANGDKKKKAKSNIANAEKSVEAAKQKLSQPIDPSDPMTPLVGAKWSATRFANSAKDDPTPVYPKQSTGRRTALANWIASPKNPLTARVAVNQIWMRHMGSPLVESVFDFGRKSPRPIQQKLLDWLAADFVENNWSMKHLHQLIVTSNAYRMSSTKASAADIDRENNYWTQREPVRLESQVIRDTILFHAGTLELKVGGPPIAAAQQSQSNRRSLYFFHSNNDRNQFLRMFDEALVTDCYRRDQSIVPQQSLALNNSKLTNQSAAQISKAFSKPNDTDRVFIASCFKVLLGIEPSENEIGASLQALASWRNLANGNTEKSRARFVMILINHSDFITVR